LRDLTVWIRGIRCLSYKQLGTWYNVIGWWEAWSVRDRGRGGICSEGAGWRAWDGCTVGGGEMGNLRGEVLVG